MTEHMVRAANPMTLNACASTTKTEALGVPGGRGQRKPHLQAQPRETDQQHGAVAVSV